VSQSPNTPPTLATIAAGVHDCVRFARARVTCARRKHGLHVNFLVILRKDSTDSKFYIVNLLLDFSKKITAMASKHAFGSASVAFLHKLSSTCAPARDNEAFAT
jgi:hypothetical protein